MGRRDWCRKASGPVGKEEEEMVGQFSIQYIRCEWRTCVSVPKVLRREAERQKPGPP
jgi:ribosome biogenesis protein Tsr3